MLTDDQLKKLTGAVERSYRQLEPFRRLTKGLIAEYAGPGYGEAEEGTREKYMNLMNQAVDAYMMLLAGSTPRILTSTHASQHRAFAKRMQIAGNNLLKRINFAETHAEWVMDAFFNVGIVKIHMADSGQVVAEGNVEMDPGMPFVSNISIDDFVYDTEAKKLTEATYIGDMYRLPREALNDAAIYDQDVVAEMGEGATLEAGAGSDRIDRLSVGYESDDNRIYDDIDVADIYVPRAQMVYTFLVESRNRFTINPRCIAKYKWIGTERGPYRKLGFNPVPKNIMPVGPASHLAPLDRLSNNLMNKQANQAQRQKENPVYTPAGTDGAKGLQNAIDGQWVPVNDAREVSVIRQGGSDPGNQAFMLNTVQLFDRMAGNLPALIGLGATSDTVGQEKLIHSSASKKGAQMQKQVLDATTDVIRELLYLLWQDGFTTIPGEMTIPQYPQYRVRADWTPDLREGQFSDYEVDIDVHSMTYQGPAERIGAINSLLTQIYAPMAQMLAEQGGTINFAQLTEIYAELLNLPRLREVVVFSNPLAESQGPGGEGGGSSMPASTERRYVRQDANGGAPAVPDASAWTGVKR